jgi:hypothetical protein
MPTSVVVFATWLVASAAVDQDFRENSDFLDLVIIEGKADTTSLLMAVFGIALIAALVQTFQIQFVRLFEGYWGRLYGTTLLRAIGVRRQLRRYDRLERLLDESLEILGEVEPPRGSRPLQALRRDSLRRIRATAIAELVPQELLHGYPPNLKNHTLPTRLGNAMRSFEFRAGERYGYKTLTTWPHLYFQLSDRVVTSFQGAVDALHAAVNFALAFLLASVVFIAGAFGKPAWWFWLPGACLVLAMVAYRGAVSAARLVGLIEYVSFDLHRFDLLQALHQPLPFSGSTETAAAKELSELLEEKQPFHAQKKLKDVIYRHPPRK